MQNNNIFNSANIDILCCPVCSNGIKLSEDNSALICLNEFCKIWFPIYNGIPCILNEQNSVFSNKDFANQKNVFFKLKEKKLKKLVKKIIPELSLNIVSKINYNKFAEYLTAENKLKTKKKILVIGGSIIGQGMEELLSKFPFIEFIETDVSFGPRTMLICDGHNLPFTDGSFDGVIVQAVLEHVVDPYTCVNEIHRVLNENGLVYAETPFMQQVHGRQFDFTRFTHLGHRRLFRSFEELSSGAVSGPGMALAWSYRYFLLSFSTNSVVRKFLNAFAAYTAFYLKYFDYLLINKKGTLDAASGYYFMGKKSNKVLTDNDLLKLYDGAF